MENFTELAEIKDDPRFGDITILYNTLNPSKRAMRTVKVCNSAEEFHAINEQVHERQRINSPYIMNLLHIEIDEANLKTLVYFEYPEDRLYDESLTPDEAVRLFIDILQAICFLQGHKMIHGDIRPEYISYIAAERRYKLMDRLNDLSPPLQCQLNNITSMRPLYMAPIIFNELTNKERKIKQHSYKSELFSLGFICLGAFHAPAALQELYNTDQRCFEAETLTEVLGELLDAVMPPLHADFLRFLQEDVLQVEERLRLNPKKALEKLREVPSFKLLFAVADDAAYQAAELLPAHNMKFYDPFEFVPHPRVAARGDETRSAESPRKADTPPVAEAAQQPAEDAPGDELAFDFVEIPRTVSADMLDHFASLGIHVDEDSEQNDARLVSKIKKSSHLSTFREELVAAEPPRPAPLSKLSDLFRTKLSHGAVRDSVGESKFTGSSMDRTTLSSAEGKPVKSIAAAGTFTFPNQLKRAEPGVDAGDTGAKSRFHAEIQTTYKLARGAENISSTADVNFQAERVSEEKSGPQQSPLPVEKELFRPRSDVIYGFGVKSIGETPAPRQTVPGRSAAVEPTEPRPSSEPSLRDLFRRSAVEEPYVILAPSMHSKDEIACGSQSSRSALAEGATPRGEALPHASLTRINSSMREVDAPMPVTRNINLYATFVPSCEKTSPSRDVHTPAKPASRAEADLRPVASVPAMASATQTHAPSPLNELLSPMPVSSMPPSHPAEAVIAPFAERETAMTHSPQPLFNTTSLIADGGLANSSIYRANATRRISALQTREESVRSIVDELTSPPKDPIGMPPPTPNFLLQKTPPVEMRQAPLPTFAAGQSWKRAASPARQISPVRPRQPTRVALDGSYVRGELGGRITPLRPQPSPQPSPDRVSPLQKKFPARKISDFSASYDANNRWPSAQPVAMAPHSAVIDERPYAFAAPNYALSGSYSTTRPRVEGSPHSAGSYAHYYQMAEQTGPSAQYPAQYANTTATRVYYAHSHNVLGDGQMSGRIHFPEAQTRSVADNRMMSTTWVDVYPGQR